MHILENVPLSGHSTMRLGGNARYLCEITNRSEIPEVVTWAEEHQVPLVMVGGGSNIFWSDEGFSGLVVVNKIAGFEAVKQDETTYIVTIGAGENWDAVVGRTVDMGLSGIEQLSLIPGTAGATPIQNVGAYGREIAEVLTSIDAYDLTTKQFVILGPQECTFSYRSSRFKTTDKGRFLLAGITLKLTTIPPHPPFYKALEDYLSLHHITSFTPIVIREAVVAIRTSKLPNPDVVANNGSFFANPIIPKAEADQLLKAHADLPHWEVAGGKVKLSAAWLVEHAGFKDVHDDETGMATWPTQSLVLVNEHAHSTADLLKFRQKILDAVTHHFGVTLQQEPELMENA